MGKQYIEIKSREESEFQKDLEKRDDSDAQRMVRFLNYPDLTRDESSPLFELVRRIKNIGHFFDFDEIKTPEIVPSDICFDLFNFPIDHPARSKSDTYYVDDKHILRTHTTIMWYYYLNSEIIKEKIKNKLSMGALSYGKVYRKDEIDRNHMNVFHQIDGWYLSPKSKEIITIDDLKSVLTEIAQAIFGKEIKFRFNIDKFPYTDPSCEMEIEVDGRWVEVLGSGIVHPDVLRNLGVDPNKYNGWAFGFGLDRLAMMKYKINDIRLLRSGDLRFLHQF